MGKLTSIGLIAAIILVSAAFVLGCKDDKTRAHDAFLAAMKDSEIGDPRMSEIVLRELRPVFESEEYWDLVWERLRHVDPADHEAIKAVQEINAKLFKNGMQRLERYQLLELNRIRLSISGRSVPTCAAMWRGTATDKMIFEALDLKDARAMAALLRQAAMLELSSGGRPPMTADEAEKALVDGVGELLGKGNADGVWYLREVVFAGKPITDSQACTLTQTVARGTPRLEAGLQDRFLRAFYSASADAN